MLLHLGSAVALLASGAPIAHAYQGSRLPTPRDTGRYVILNHGRPTGRMDVVATGDSVAVTRQFGQRGSQANHETTYVLDARGYVVRFARTGTGVVPGVGATTERFVLENGIARWSSPGDSGQAPARDAAYLPHTPIAYDNALLARALLRRPDRRIALLPSDARRSDTARLEIAAETTLVVGGARRRLRLALIEGLPAAVFFLAIPVWLDDEGALVASQASAWFVTVRRGDEPLLPALRAIELALAARRAGELARRLAPNAAGAMVIRGGDVFDSERGIVRPRTTVVVRGDRIVALGPADSIDTPPGATVIDAAGKTVLPGMWDMHVHLPDPLRGASTFGVMWLAAGITTARDLGTDVDVAVPFRDGARAGTVLAPRMLLAGFLDGPGEDVGPTDAVVATPEAARAWVARYDSLGYRQVKIYNLIRPELVPVIAADARRRGMRVSGHVPRGMRLQDAVQAGLDEVNHGRYVISNFLPDSAQRGPSYGLGLARYDVGSPEMTELITRLKERGTVVDGTLNLHEDRWNLLPDGTHPVFGPTFARLPLLMRRNLRPAPPESPEAAATRRGVVANLYRLVKRLHDGGVTLVAGTDAVPGLSYHGELEIYQRAGIPAPRVLQIATIVPARVMGDDRDYGSITPGKIADLVIVDGRPADDIRHLRRTEWVLRAGRLYRSADLYRAAGITSTMTSRPATAP